MELLAARGWEIRTICPKEDGHINEAEFLGAIDKQTDSSRLCL